jgi:hypothetical protein
MKQGIASQEYMGLTGVRIATGLTGDEQNEHE